MHKFGIVAVLAVALLGSFFLGRTAQSQSRSSTVRFEYKCISGSKAAQWERRADRNTNQFNVLGAKGWELVTVDSILYCFKRPVR